MTDRQAHVPGPDARLRPAETTVCRALDEGGGSVALLNLDTGAYYGLNAVGATLWRLLEAGQTPAELVESVLAEYPDAGRDTVADDVRTFLADLAELQLIVVDEAG